MSLGALEVSTAGSLRSSVPPPAILDPGCHPSCVLPSSPSIAMPIREKPRIMNGMGGCRPVSLLPHHRVRRVASLRAISAEEGCRSPAARY